MPLVDCWYLIGATAAGKTAVGLELARRLSAEIVSLDSMALYRGMDIGTAKPSPAEQAAVPHHLIDILDPGESFSVAQYVAAAEAAVADIERRGRQALFVGGTPLYLKALLRGIFRGPAADWEFRRELESEASRRGGAWLRERLRQVDPATAERLHDRDTKRLIRALEVFHLTGRPISELQKQFDRARRADDCRVFVLDWPRPQLHERINARVDQMFAGGLVDEVRRLLAAPAGLGRTAGQALGYREVAEFLSGVRDLPATMDLVKLRTRQFAKRQLTWFRSLSECRFVAVSNGDTPAQIAARIAGEGLTREA